MAKGKSNSVESEKKKIDKELSKRGLSYKTVAGAIIVIIGVLLVLFNIVPALYEIVGLVLVYFGLRLLGYNPKL